MVTSVPAAHLSALAASQLVIAEYIWFTVRNRSTGLPESEGIWSGAGTVLHDIYNIDTQAVENRQWTGVGSLVTMTPIAKVANLTIQDVEITIPHLNEALTRIARTHDAKQGRVELYRGLFDPLNNTAIAPAQSRFSGFINHVELKTPAAGEVGNAVLHCKSNALEFNRFNPELRSHTSQRQRNSSDTFYKGVETAHQAEIFWGTKEVRK